MVWLRVGEFGLVPDMFGLLLEVFGFLLHVFGASEEMFCFVLGRYGLLHEMLEMLNLVL